MTAGIDKWGRFEWYNDVKTIKVYPDRNGAQLCIHAEVTPVGNAVGSGVCFECTMKTSDDFKNKMTEFFKAYHKEKKK